jgi:hypothetical protein
VFMYPIVDRRADFHPSWTNNSCRIGPATVQVKCRSAISLGKAESALTAVVEVLHACLAHHTLHVQCRALIAAVIGPFITAGHESTCDHAPGGHILPARCALTSCLGAPIQVDGVLQACEQLGPPRNCTLAV